MNHVLCVVALMMVLVLSSPAQAQNQGMPGCVNELGPCRRFVNSTTATPPTACCQPFARLLQNDLSCLCSIFVSVEVTRSLSINVTEAATLPLRCGLQFDLVAQCRAVLMAPSEAPAMSPVPSSMAPAGPVSPAPALVMAPSEGPSMSPNAAPTPTAAPTPAPAPAPGHSTGGASNIAWAGSAIMGSFLIWANMMLY